MFTAGDWRCRIYFRQGVLGIGLSIEMGTEAVPNDGQFHVVHDGEIVFSSSSKARALQEYRKRRDALLAETGHEAPVIDPEDALRRERALAELRAVRSKGVRDKLRIPSRRGYR